jgi:hypothetical protein
VKGVPLELKLMRVGVRHHAMVKHSISLGNAGVLSDFDMLNKRAWILKTTKKFI